MKHFINFSTNYIFSTNYKLTRVGGFVKFENSWILRGLISNNTFEHFNSAQINLTSIITEKSMYLKIIRI